MRYILLVLMVSVSFWLSAQVEAPHCNDAKFNNKVASYLTGQIPSVDVSVVKLRQDKALILDAREYEEYAISHIPGAVWIGYDKPNFDILSEVSKDREIYIYCSIGYRSEQLGKKIKNKGYSRIYNVYGSIFEWANRSWPLENEQSMVTDSVHTYNKKWSKWVNNDEVKKVY